MRAWTAHHRHHEVAPLEPRDRGPDLDDLAQRLVADDEVFRPVRRGAVLEGADLPIGAADADVQHAELHVGGRSNRRGLLLDQSDLPSTGDDGNSLHSLLPSRIAPTTAPESARSMRLGCRWEIGVTGCYAVAR